MNILSTFNFLACTLQNSRIPQEMKVPTQTVRVQAAPMNSPHKAVRTWTLWASAEQHAKDDMLSRSQRGDLFCGQRKHDGFLKYFRHWSFKP